MACNVCPWWLGYFLASPLRKRLGHDPDAILGPYIQPGMKALDVGSGMGYFTIPMAKMVGPEGQVYAVDLQEKMIKSLKRRAAKPNVQNRIETRVCSLNSLLIDDLAGSIDFALTFAMVHEVPDKPRLFHELSNALKPGGLLLIAEPKGHVNEDDFAKSIQMAEEQGLKRIASPTVSYSIAALLKKVI